MSAPSGNSSSISDKSVSTEEGRDWEGERRRVRKRGCDPYGFDFRSLPLFVCSNRKILPEPGNPLFHLITMCFSRTDGGNVATTGEKG